MALRTRAQRETWSLERLRYERSVALGFCLEPGTRSAYRSHLKSYTAFCDRHELSIEPTADTLSLYVAYESHYIDPRSVKTYLSGLCNALESSFPDVRTARTSAIVRNTLEDVSHDRLTKIPAQCARCWHHGVKVRRGVF